MNLCDNRARVRCEYRKHRVGGLHVMHGRSNIADQRFLLGTELDDFVKRVGKPVPLHPIVETEIVLKVCINQVGHVDGAKLQFLTRMMNVCKRIRLNKLFTRDRAGLHGLDVERQIRQSVNCKLVVIAVQRIGVLKRQRRVVVLWQFHSSI